MVNKGSCPYTYCCYAHNSNVYIIYYVLLHDIGAPWTA